MIDFIKYFFRIKKINFLLTFLSLLNFGIMFGAKKDKEEYKIEIKFEKKDKVEKEPLPFIMFLKKFCETFGLSTEDLNTKEAEDQKYNYFTNSKYDFYFCYIDGDDDKIIVSTDEDFKIFYTNKDCYEEKSKIRHLFFSKNEDNNKIKVYDEIIKNKNFKNISITVYINEDIEEEKKEENIENKANKANNEEEKKKKKNNDCPCCNCCLDCFNHCWKKKL